MIIKIIPNLMHYSRYQDILQDEFQKLVAINPSYSMRAFANKLEIAPSRLSEILREKQGLSLKSAQKITKILKLDPHRRKYFELLVQSKHAKSQAQKERAFKDLNEYIDGDLKKVPVDLLDFLSGWYHFGILELIKTQDIVHSTDWISKRLRISQEITDAAIRRLKRLKMLAYKEGKFIALENNPVTTCSEIPNNTIRFYHKQFIEKAQLSVDEQDMAQRSLNTLVIAVNEEDKKEINKKINEFFNQINIEYSKNTENKTAVYALSNQFFELGEKL